jgi:hypothetical protein
METKEKLVYPPWIGGATTVEDSPYMFATKFGIATLPPIILAPMLP